MPTNTNYASQEPKDRATTTTTRLFLIDANFMIQIFWNRNSLIDSLQLDILIQIGIYDPCLFSQVLKS